MRRKPDPVLEFEQFVLGNGQIPNIAGMYSDGWRTYDRLSFDKFTILIFVREKVGSGQNPT